MSTIQLAVHMGVALVLGALIGTERQWRQRMAGLRTNTLVCIGAALFVSLSLMTEGETSPTRVAAQVASGIGFLGAGVIFKEGATVRGLNTAATLWCSAAIGVLTGTGQLLAATIGTLAILVVNTILRPLVLAINRQPKDHSEFEYVYRVQVSCRAEDENHIRSQLLAAVDHTSLALRGLWSEDLVGEGHRAQVHADLATLGRQDLLMEKIIRAISLEPGISAVSWQALPESGNGLDQPQSYS